MTEEAAATSGRVKRIVIIALAVLCAAGVGALVIFANQPSRGTAKIVQNDADTKKTAEPTPSVFDGRYLSFTYRGNYVVKTHDTDDRADAVILESAYISETSAISKKIGLTVRHLPTRNADDDPDYTMRRQNPDRYRMDTFDIDGKQGASFTSVDQGAFEKTFFVRHGDMMVSLTLGSPGAEDGKLDAEADALVGSIRWAK